MLARRRLLAAITTVVAGATLLAAPAANAAEAHPGLVSQSIAKTVENNLASSLFDGLGLSVDDTIKETMDVTRVDQGLGDLDGLFDQVGKVVGDD